MGTFVISPLPPVLAKTCRAARPLRSTGVTPLLRYSEPNRHRLAVSRFPGVAGYTAYPAPPIARWDEDGFSSCSTCPCHRAAPNHPADVTSRLGQPRGLSWCLRPEAEGSAFGILFFRGHHWVHLRCGPVTRSPSPGWLRRSASSASF